MDPSDVYSNGTGRNYESSNNSLGFGLVVILFVVLSMLAIYYLYRYLYTSANTSATVLIGSEQAAISPPSTPPKGPLPSEGGDFSVNTWVYINSYNKNRNTRKHIFEIQGQYFSTLLIALGSFKNTLTVRTQTNDVLQGVANGARGGSRNTDSSTPESTSTPNTETVGSLLKEDVKKLFAPLAMDDDLLTTPLTCDIQQIDLQRWTMITVVLSGRTIDVYMDGKLTRSCISSSYYKVDPTGAAFNITDRGGFDGYIGNTSVGAYSMSPDEIYRMYMSGPSGPSSDIWAWIASIFKGAKTN
jgi:hypothetical protein